MPEQSMHMKQPMFRDAHLGAFVPQSKQFLFSGCSSSFASASCSLERYEYALLIFDNCLGDADLREEAGNSRRGLV
jgi:hypothetical protein